jgi:hypothetical protein
VFPSRQVRRERGQSPENAQPVGCREAGAEAQPLFQGPRGLFSVPLIGTPLVGSPYDVAPTGRALPAASAVSSAARTPATVLIGAVFVAPSAPRR